MCLPSQELFRRKQQRDLGYTVMMMRLKVTNHIKNDGLHTTNLMLAEGLGGLVHQCKVSDRRFQFRVHVTEKRATTKLE